MKTMHVAITEVEETIRALVNAPRKRNALMAEPARWNTLCNCLDLIGDTDLALRAYRPTSDSVDDGEQYLIISGTLQTLFVQQDAVERLAEVLEFSYQTAPALKEIRNIRTDVSAQPLRGDLSTDHLFDGVARLPMRKSGGRLVHSGSPRTPASFRNVDVPRLIEIQQNYVHQALSNFATELEKEHKDHIIEFRGRRVQDTFPDSLSYYLSKMYESAAGKSHPELGKANLNMVEQVLQTFKDALAERGLLGAYAEISVPLELLAYPLAELRTYFKHAAASRLNKQDAYIFISFVEAQLADLRAMAAEIDTDYEQAGAQ